MAVVLYEVLSPFWAPHAAGYGDESGSGVGLWGDVDGGWGEVEGSPRLDAEVWARRALKPKGESDILDWYRV